MTRMDTREQIALDYYDRGVPSVNPDYRMRYETERHRWGRHIDHPRPKCPVCQRSQARDLTKNPR